jgi:hypothetical protein
MSEGNFPKRMCDTTSSTDELYQKAHQHFANKQITEACKNLVACIHSIEYSKDQVPQNVRELAYSCMAWDLKGFLDHDIDITRVWPPFQNTETLDQKIQMAPESLGSNFNDFEREFIYVYLRHRCNVTEETIDNIRKSWGNSCSAIQKMGTEVLANIIIIQLLSATAKDNGKHA